MDILSDDEDQIQHNPQFQRLMELKNLYNSTKNSLKVSNHSSSTTVSTVGSTLTIEERTTQTTVSRKPKSEAPDSAQLIAAIRSLLLKHGGLCHIDTVVEHIRSKFPSFRRRDGTSAIDTKKTIQSTLRYNSRGTVLKDDEGNLLLGDGDVDPKELTSITSLITQAIEDGITTSSLITSYVLKNFARENVDSTDEDLREGVTVTLKTNPKFKRDSRNNYYLIQSPKKSRISKTKRVRSEEDNSDESSGESPPPGYVCRCGVTITGKGSMKWRKGAGGESLCYNCGLQYKKKDKKKEKEKEKEKEKDIDNNPWICCDKCHKWLRAKSDNIDDISIYDDSNPNHLDYYCPACRAKGEISKDGGKTRSKSNRRGRQDEPVVEVKVDKKRVVNGGRKLQRRGEDEIQAGDSKLDAVEKELLQALEQEEDASESMDYDEGEKYRANLNRIADDIRKLKNSLVATRNTIWEKNQKDFEAQVEKLEQERRSLNERAELDLVRQLRDFYEKKKPKSETNSKASK